GRTLYPDVGSPRAIRDPVDHALSGFGLSQPYRKILEALTGLERPVAGQKEGDTNQPGKDFGGFTSGSDLPGLTRIVDPYAAAYWALRKMEWDWMARRGEGQAATGGTPLFDYLGGRSARPMALWFYRTAKRLNNQRLAEQWKAEYIRLGGKGLLASIAAQAPLHDVPSHERSAFKAYLEGTTGGADILRDAQAYHSRLAGRPISAPSVIDDDDQVPTEGIEEGEEAADVPEVEAVPAAEPPPESPEVGKAEPVTPKGPAVEPPPAPAEADQLAAAEPPSPPAAPAPTAPDLAAARSLRRAKNRPQWRKVVVDASANEGSIDPLSGLITLPAGLSDNDALTMLRSAHNLSMAARSALQNAAVVQTDEGQTERPDQLAHQMGTDLAALRRMAVWLSA
ncbi:MAG: hypothetical protein MUP86_02310, partial [Dehalococcoidia bacterium]|nr:hypothetical protein [Dehalococcoidia bacterium]